MKLGENRQGLVDSFLGGKLEESSYRYEQSGFMNRLLDIESIDHALKTARSIRRKLDFNRDVPLAVVKECIDVAVQAPVGLAGENWRFIVVSEPSAKSRIASVYGDILIELTEQRGVELKPTHRALVKRLHEIPCMILVCAENFSPSEIHAGIPLGRKFLCANNALRAVRIVARQAEEVLLGCNHRGDS